MDVAYAIGTYAACVGIRALVVLVHFPLLRRLGYGMSGKDATVVAWGGLHGSVGLALALSMDREFRQFYAEDGDPANLRKGKQVLPLLAQVRPLRLGV